MFLTSKRNTSKIGKWYGAWVKNKITRLLQEEEVLESVEEREKLGGKKSTWSWKEKNKAKFSRNGEQSFWSEDEEDVRLHLGGAKFSHPLTLTWRTSMTARPKYSHFYQFITGASESILTISTMFQSILQDTTPCVKAPLKIWNDTRDLYLGIWIQLFMTHHWI